MPYSGPDDPQLPTHVGKLTPEQRKKWVAVFNDAMESCKEGKEECERMALAAANDRVSGEPTGDKAVHFTRHVGEVYDTAVFYTSATTLSGAMAERELRQDVMELRECLALYEQVINNIMYSSPPGGEDGREALAEVAREFADLISEKVEGDGEDEYKARQLFQTRDGVKYPASSFLVVVDSQKPSTWHLPVKTPDGKPDHRLMGAAWAALHEGFRGKEYRGPGKQEAIRKLKRLYKREGLDLPGEKKAVGTGTEQAVRMTDEQFDAYLGPRYVKSVMARALGSGRIGGYAALWGDETRKDLTGEYFHPGTAEMDALFNGLGRLPLLYHHALDDRVKTAVVGVVDVLERDDVGLWYEAQRKMSSEYDAMIDRLIAEGKLKTSSQTLASGRKVAPNGRIERWPIVEISLTPAPAEPRMLAAQELKGIYQQIGCEDLSCVLNALGKNADDTGGAEKARWAKRLQLERDYLEIIAL